LTDVPENNHQVKNGYQYNKLRQKEQEREASTPAEIPDLNPKRYNLVILTGIRVDLSFSESQKNNVI
jgi:hypothetical protein